MGSDRTNRDFCEKDREKSKSINNKHYISKRYPLDRANRRRGWQAEAQHKGQRRGTQSREEGGRRREEEYALKS